MDELTAQEIEQGEQVLLYLTSGETSLCLSRAMLDNTQPVSVICAVIDEPDGIVSMYPLAVVADHEIYKRLTVPGEDDGTVQRVDGCE